MWSPHADSDAPDATPVEWLATEKPQCWNCRPTVLVKIFFRTKQGNKIAKTIGDSCQWRSQLRFLWWHRYRKSTTVTFQMLIQSSHYSVYIVTQCSQKVLFGFVRGKWLSKAKVQQRWWFSTRQYQCRCPRFENRGTRKQSIIEQPHYKRLSHF